MSIPICWDMSPISNCFDASLSWPAARTAKTATMPRAVHVAAAGGGKDAGHLRDQDRANLRRQAATWLGAELNQLKTRLLRGKEGDKSMVKKRLSHWTTDPDLRSVRDATELGELPGETAQEWKVFWSEVAEVLKLKVRAAT